MTEVEINKHLLTLLGFGEEITEDLEGEAKNLIIDCIRSDNWVRFFQEKFLAKTNSLNLRGIKEPLTMHEIGSIQLYNKYEERLSGMEIFTYEEEYVDNFEIVRESYICF